MPALVLFGRRALVAGDDLRAYSAVGSSIRICQLGVGIALLVTSTNIRRTEIDRDCLTDEEARSLIGTSCSFFTVSIVVGAVGLITEQAVMTLSARGTPTQPEKRHLLRPLCHFDLTVMMALRIIMTAIGSYSFFSVQKYCNCVKDVTQCPGFGYHLYFFFVVIHAIDLAFNAVIMLYLGCKCLPDLPYQMDSEYKWRIFCRCCCTVSSILTCCIVGGREAITGDFTDISMLLADFFNFRGTLDLVPSDIVAGLVMVKRVQEEGASVRRQAAAERAAESRRRPQRFEASEGSRGRTLDEAAPQVNARASAAPVSYRWKRPVRSGRGAYWEAKATQLLAREREGDLIAMAEGARFMRLSLAIYTWFVYVKQRPMKGPCELSAESAKRLCKRRKRYAGDGRICPFHAAAFLKRAGIEDSEIIYAQFRSGVVECPYAIVLDHDWQSVVIVIRGTMSLEDLVTDLTLRPTCMEEAGAKYGFDGTNQYAHSGMLQSAIWILDDIEEKSSLKAILGTESRFSKYVLRITGHSLGAGVAAILSLMLRPRYPYLSGHCFSPPGCTLSSTAADETRKFLTAYVLDSDIVIRLCLESLENLRYDLVEMISRIKVPKRDVIGCCHRKITKGLDLHESNCLILHPEGEWPESSFTKSWQQYQELYLERKEARDFPDVQLYPPGKIIQLIRLTAHEKKSLFSGGQAPVEYVSRWASREDFREIRISGTCMDDHDPQNVLARLQDEACRLGLKPPAFLVGEQLGGDGGEDTTADRSPKEDV